MDFILIDIGSGFGNEELESFVTEQSYNGIVGIADRGILKLLDVKIQSTTSQIICQNTLSKLPTRSQLFMQQCSLPKNMVQKPMMSGQKQETQNIF